ncbi:enoyl-CoA hydratase/isomerase family protein [Pseudohaliea rubra]|uniref:Enoyl-CoA hydratase n=1 Tax=Pseudohaliea rubra DSM 19751 TaxID=1265313 RepID=A0A095X0F5_9GAMM|nr:enoyl-CoA hydratase/isomerase family protein [Pseudohaliea rubra]KGE04379.1 Enoyl-CoA hydratase [Pseudohaliea rubra DSM 19751]
MKQAVTRENHSGVCILTLNRPEKLNAINARLVQEFGAALASALACPDDKVILLRGEGRAFCAGNDLEASEEQAAPGIDRGAVEAHAAALQEISRGLMLGDKPVVGAIHGWAVGAGFEWALNCDLTVWGQSTRAFFPELALGLFPTGGVLSLLPRTVGLARAREMFLLGEKYDADTLHALGLAGRVVSDERVFEEALAIAQRLLMLPGSAVARWKRAAHEAMTLTLDATLDREAEALVAAICEDGG